jgi:dephospho-CoA kinase
MTFVVAVTGSTASGKSTAVNFFADKGVTVISADEINRSLLEPNTPTFLAIAKHFGKSILNEQGHLNKQALRSVIFSNPVEKKWLEDLLHPIIRKKMQDQLASATGRYVVIEIPLLKSRSDYPYLNRVLLLESDPSVQIKRIMQRDHCGYEQAAAVLKNHSPNSVKRQLADDIITNNQSTDALHEQLNQLHQQYSALAQLK